MSQLFEDANHHLSGLDVLINLHDFRDPKVWKHEGLWYTVTGVTDGVSDLINPSNYETNGFGKVCLHRSENLNDWTFVGYCVESLGELGTMLECPNIFKLGDKHVLMYSPMGMQQRQVVYLVGDLDYRTGKFHWSTMGSLDWGCDYYAPQVFDDENGRTLIQAWIGSWPFMPWCGGRYDTSELGWYGSITLAREVALCHDGELKFTPVQETENPRHSPKRHSPPRLNNGEKFAFETGDNIEDSTGLYVYAKNGHAKIETLKTFGMKNVVE